MPSLDNYFGFNIAATSVKSRRLEIISGNITNASTPGYKARDLYFAKILKQYSMNGAGGGAQATQPKHIGAGVASWENVDSAITYYHPLNSSPDDNTVELMLLATFAQEARSTLRRPPAHFPPCARC